MFTYSNHFEKYIHYYKIIGTVCLKYTVCISQCQYCRKGLRTEPLYCLSVHILTNCKYFAGIPYLFILHQIFQNPLICLFSISINTVIQCVYLKCQHIDNFVTIIVLRKIFFIKSSISLENPHTSITLVGIPFKIGCGGSSQV